MLESKEDNLVIECIGPEITHLRKYSEITFINRQKKITITFATPIAKLTAKIFQLLPNPLLTEDQLTMLKYDIVNQKAIKVILI